MRKGFSFLEGIIVVVIILIISSLAGNSILNWIHKDKVKSVAKELLADIEWARSLAFKRGSSRILFTDIGYEIYSPADSNKPILKRKIPSQIKLEQNLSGEIEFKRNKLPNKSGTITIKGYGIAYKIVINSISGRIYIEQTP